MDKFIKRLQTRASRKGISVSKSQVREVYTQVADFFGSFENQLLEMRAVFGV